MNEFVKTVTETPEGTRVIAGVKVVAVTDFCKKYRLNAVEERRLRMLFGHFASEPELLRNATRAPRFR